MNKKWWKESVVYQIYPRSFMDSNNDGIGDLNGISSKLDYLKELGIDVIWLCPVYKSPNDDNGYDISDYQDIMKEFGTMEQFDELLEGIHKRGMKLIMDLVVNHTSDEHQWFVESSSSKENEYRDFYIWKQGKNNKEPNNWLSYFQGSTWQYSEETQEYYLHLFSKKQPDLNWENPKVRKEIYKLMTWWIDKGIDGFRMDVINYISKSKELPSVPSNKEYVCGNKYYANGPKVHEYLKEMNEKVLSKYDIMTVGEMADVTPKEALLYVAEERRELNMIFHFELNQLASNPDNKWDTTTWYLKDFKSIITTWQLKLQNNNGWDSLFLNNHDSPRMVSHFGNDNLFRVESAKMLATLLHTLRGTPYIYQGEEIGMTNVNFESIDFYRDIETINMYDENVREIDSKTLMKSIHIMSRDNARTPMQWDDTQNAGFTIGNPWIDINPNYVEINVKKAIKDPDSIFNYYKKLIKLRKRHPIIVYGKYNIILEEHEQIYAYTRKYENKTLLVILNFSTLQADFTLPEDIVFKEEELLISNYNLESKDIKNIELKPYEARVYLLQ